MVFESGLTIVQIPLEVTHTVHLPLLLTSPLTFLKVLVTKEIFATLNEWNSPFSRLFSSLLSFFEETYRTQFGFSEPPLHDPVAVAYVIDPQLFTTSFVHVDIETQSSFCR